jgi:hypothetical protein
MISQPTLSEIIKVEVSEDPPRGDGAKNYPQSPIRPHLHSSGIFGSLHQPEGIPFLALWPPPQEFFL